MTEKRDLHKVHAFCPHCLEDASGAGVCGCEVNKVWITRTCPEHGEFTTYLAERRTITSGCAACNALMSRALKVMDQRSSANAARAAGCANATCVPWHARRDRGHARRCNAKCPVCFARARII